MLTIKIATTLWFSFCKKDMRDVKFETSAKTLVPYSNIKVLSLGE